MSEAPLVDNFAEIEDSRCSRNPLYAIEEIVLLAICRMIRVADDFVALEELEGVETRLAAWIFALRARDPVS